MLGYVIRYSLHSCYTADLIPTEEEIHRAIETRSQLFYFLVAFFPLLGYSRLRVRDKEDSLYSYWKV